MAKCPKCENLVVRVHCEHVTIADLSGDEWHGNAYSCCLCGAVLGVEINPVAIGSDVADSVAALVLERLEVDLRAIEINMIDSVVARLSQRLDRLAARP